MTLQSIKVFSITAIELSYPYSSPVQYLFKDVDSVGQDVSSVNDFLCTEIWSRKRQVWFWCETAMGFKS